MLLALDHVKRIHHFITEHFLCDIGKTEHFLCDIGKAQQQHISFKHAEYIYCTHAFMYVHKYLISIGIHTIYLVFLR